MACQHLHLTQMYHIFAHIRTMLHNLSTLHCKVLDHIFTILPQNYRNPYYLSTINTNYNIQRWRNEIKSPYNYKCACKSCFLTAYMYATACLSMAGIILFTSKHAILIHLPYTARQNKDIKIQLQIFMILCNLQILYVLTLYQQLYLPLFILKFD